MQTLRNSVLEVQGNFTEYYRTLEEEHLIALEIQGRNLYEIFSKNKYCVMKRYLPEVGMLGNIPSRQNRNIKFTSALYKKV